MPSLFKKIFGGGKGKGDSSTGKASTDNVASGADRAATTQKMQPQQSKDLPDKSSPEIQAVLDAAAAENAAAAGMQQAQQGVKCKAGAHGASSMHSVQRQRVHDKHAPTLTPQETASLAQRSVQEPARASTANMSAPMGASMDGGEKGVRCPDTGKWYTESEIIALEAAKKKQGMAKNETAAVKGDEYDELREKVVAYKDRKGVASATGAATAQATPSLQREASDTPLPPPADALPTGWRSNIDPKSGKEYYYNKVLNVTQWTRPVVCYPDKSRAPPPVLTSTSSAPSQANKPKQAAARGGGQSEKATVAAQLSADDVEMYDSLKKELENLTANVRDRMRLCKAKEDNAGFLEHGMEYKYYLSATEWLQARQDECLPLPAHRSVPRVVTKPDGNPAVPPDVLRVIVHSISGITHTPADKLQVVVSVPTKDSGRDEQTSDAVKNCQDFKEWTTDFKGWTTDALHRRRLNTGKAKVMVEVSAISGQGFFSKGKVVLLAKNELSLSGLKDSASVALSDVKLLDAEKGQKAAACGGTVSVSVEVCAPLGNSAREYAESFKNGGVRREIKVTERVMIFLEQTIGDAPPKKPASVLAEHARLIAAADAAPLPPIAGGIGRPSASSPAPAAAAGPRKAGAGGGGGARGSPGGARQQLPKGVSLEKMYDDGNKLYRESVLRGEDLCGDDLKVQAKVVAAVDKLRRARELLLEVHNIKNPYRESEQILSCIEKRLDTNPYKMVSVTRPLKQPPPPAATCTSDTEPGTGGGDGEDGGGGSGTAAAGMGAKGKAEEQLERLDRSKGELQGWLQGQDSDWDTPSNIKSFFVLEFEEKHCDDMVHDDAEDWQARKEMIVMQKEQLELAIESNMLTPEQYISQVKAAMQGGMALLPRLSAAARTADASRLHKWIDIMKKELSEAGIEVADILATPPPAPAAVAAAPPPAPAAAVTAAAKPPPAVVAPAHSSPHPPSRAGVAAAAAAGSGAAAGSRRELCEVGDEGGVDVDKTMVFMPHSLLTYEIELNKKKLSKATSPDEQEDIKLALETLEFRLGLLEDAINFETINEENYLKDTKEAIISEKARASRLKSAGEKQEYEIALQRLKVMEAELKGF